MEKVRKFKLWRGWNVEIILFGKCLIVGAGLYDDSVNTGFFINLLFFALSFFKDSEP